MLTVTRKAGEHVVVGDPASGECVIITCLRVRDNKVRIGVTAPPSVQIWRHELLPSLGEVHPSLLRFFKDKS